MKLTIGMASYNNYAETWFTVQALRMYHDLSDTEILVVDNFGDDKLRDFISAWGHGQVRYIRDTDKQGTAAAKNKVFENALGDWVLCMDSHVLPAAGSMQRLRDYVDVNPDCLDLLQGPLLYDDMLNGADSFSTVWSDGMWGQWANIQPDRSVEPYEIPMHGMGLFCCRKDAWLGFNPEFRGFGGEEGYIHEKYRKAGHKTLCLPWLQWDHYFGGIKDYNPQYADKARNYCLGFQELGLDISPLVEHFGRGVVSEYIPVPDASKEDTLKNIFTSVYDNASWGSNESASGPGSELASTEAIRRELPLLLAKYGIKSVLDIPCGDYNWMSVVDLTGVEYIGADIVEGLVQNNRDKHPGVDFRCLNMVTDPLPKVDLVFARDVLGHLSKDNALAALKNIQESGSSYLLTTSFTKYDKNPDSPVDGGWYCINLLLAPFFMKPIYLINENCSEGGGAYNDKSLMLFDLNHGEIQKRHV
jgi:glycosyltransferase involved in cell wall biosynthesis